MRVRSLTVRSPCEQGARTVHTRAHRHRPRHSDARVEGASPHERASSGYLSLCDDVTSHTGVHTSRGSRTRAGSPGHARRARFRLDSAPDRAAIRRDPRDLIYDTERGERATSKEYDGNVRRYGSVLSARLQPATSHSSATASSEPYLESRESRTPSLCAVPRTPRTRHTHAWACAARPRPTAYATRTLRHTARTYTTLHMKRVL